MDDIHDPERDRSKPYKLPYWLKPVVPRQKCGDTVGRLQRAPSERESVASMDREMSGTPAAMYPNNAISNEVGKDSKEGKGITANGGSGKLLREMELSNETIESWESRYSMEDPHQPLKPHRTEPSGNTVLGRQVAWSPNGEWCVSVGSTNQVVVLQRWRQRKP